MDLNIFVKSVSVTASTSSQVIAEINGADPQEVLEAIVEKKGVSWVVDKVDEASVLDSIGVERIKEYFGL